MKWRLLTCFLLIWQRYSVSMFDKMNTENGLGKQVVPVYYDIVQSEMLNGACSILHYETEIINR